MFSREPTAGFKLGPGPTCKGLQFTLQTTTGLFTIRRCYWDNETTGVADGPAECPVCGWLIEDTICRNITVLPASAALVYLHDALYPFWQLVQLPDNSQPIIQDT